MTYGQLALSMKVARNLHAQFLGRRYGGPGNATRHTGWSCTLREPSSASYEVLGCAEKPVVLQEADEDQMAVVVAEVLGDVIGVC